MSDLEAIAEHINNVFNVDNPKEVIIGDLDRERTNNLTNELNIRYPQRYAYSVSVKIGDMSEEDVYTLKVKRSKEHA